MGDPMLELVENDLHGESEEDKSYNEPFGHKPIDGVLLLSGGRHGE